jgi:hypothetical protein
MEGETGRIIVSGQSRQNVSDTNRNQKTGMVEFPWFQPCGTP